VDSPDLPTQLAANRRVEVKPRLPQGSRLGGIYLWSAGTWWPRAHRTMAPVEPSAWEGPATSRGRAAGRPARYEIPGRPAPGGGRRSCRPAEWRGLSKLKLRKGLADTRAPAPPTGASGTQARRAPCHRLARESPGPAPAGPLASSTLRHAQQTQRPRWALPVKQPPRVQAEARMARIH
jgi:hypothetical protein